VDLDALRDLHEPTLSLLIYHRVREERDPIFPEELDRHEFSRQMEWLSRWFNVMPLSTAIRRLVEGTLPRRSAAVTFDDGYADNAEVALPILQRYEVPATFFVATGYLDGGLMWNDAIIHAIRESGRMLDLRAFGLGQHQLDGDACRRNVIEQIIGKLKYMPQEERSRLSSELMQSVGASAPADTMLTSEQVRKLANAGMEIGAHTVSHPILSKCDLPSARVEIADSRKHLQRLSGQPIEMFAYPNGVPGVDYDAKHVDVVRDLGYLGAVTTAAGVATKNSDRFQLPRFTPWDRSELRFLGRLAWNAWFQSRTVV
jgi:peptidoglycan/xylan/chitin deacetylase (PgdA/CDA1 family)